MGILDNGIHLIIVIDKNCFYPKFFTSVSINPGNEDKIPMQEIIKNSKLWTEGYLLGVEASSPFYNNIRSNSDFEGSLGIIYLLTLPQKEFLQECTKIAGELVEDYEGFDVEDYYRLNLLWLPHSII